MEFCGYRGQSRNFGAYAGAVRVGAEERAGRFAGQSDCRSRRYRRDAQTSSRQYDESAGAVVVPGCAAVFFDDGAQISRRHGAGGRRRRALGEALSEPYAQPADPIVGLAAQILRGPLCAQRLCGV